jgi:SAM-dependent methyltransferase
VVSVRYNGRTLYDWLLQLGASDRALDLASAGGSFSVAEVACSVIAIDEDPGAFLADDAVRRRVVARLEHLPVASGTIDLVVCNHALEHIAELMPALDEIGRVLKPSGRLYVAVPDGHGLCDGLYRCLFEGGGHVNRFRRDEFVRLIEARTGLRLARWQKLYSSFGYLRGIPDLPDAPDLQARLQRLRRLPRRAIYAAQAVLYAGTRVLDGWLKTSSAIYGWAFWFERSAAAALENPPYVNVCLYCGAGHPPDSGTRLCEVCGRRNRWWRI